MNWIFLFFISFIAGSFFPLSSEGHLVYLLSQGYNFIPLLLIASIGNTLGGMSCYFIAYLGGRPLIKKLLKYEDHKIDRWNEKLKYSSEVIAILCWLPFVGEIIATALGLISDKSLKIFIFMFIGKLARYLVIMFIAVEIL